MKAKRVTVLVLVVGLIFVFSNTALGNGTEPTARLSKVKIDNRLQINGTFEARKYKKGNKYKCIVLADLNWTDEKGITSSKKIRLDLHQPILKTSLCDYKPDDLPKIFAAKITADLILPPLNLKKTNKVQVLVLEKLIRTAASCEGLPLHLQVMYGVISIKVEETQP